MVLRLIVMENVFAPVGGEFGHALPAHGEAVRGLLRSDGAASAGIQVVPQTRDPRRSVQVGERRFRERAVAAAESDAAVGIDEQ